MRRFFLASLLVASCAHDSNGRAVPFVFEGNASSITLSLADRTISIRADRESDINSCDSADYFCVSGIVSIAVPKKCLVDRDAILPFDATPVAANHHIGTVWIYYPRSPNFILESS